MSDIPEDIREMSFEAALAELEQIVGKLESGDVDLEKSIDMYARGAQLKQHCEAKLKAAEARVEKLVIGPDGAPRGSEPFGDGDS
ncbi:MAG: exodeoxyribonuclease VII small subunit [Minwuia sp.]|uniref:exodeoxyribonuclease VII small subunit n=1 Tax=Minwuia sp. TaxID=2493630 RepID=UPI003A8356D4